MVREVRRVRLTVAASVFALIALVGSAACGDGGESVETAAIDRDEVVVAVTTAATAVSTPTRAPAPTATATPAATGVIADVVPATRAGDVQPTVDSGNGTEDLRHVFVAPISSQVVLDPVFADFGDSRELHYEIFAGLTEFGDDDAGTPVRLAMASIHDASPDGLEHSFQLRQGLRFSDGSPVSAADFKWSWERALRVAANTEVDTQAERVLGNIVGADAMLAGEAEDLVGVSAVDERSLTIRLKQPATDLLYLLAHPAAAVLQRSNVEGWGIDWSDHVAARGEFHAGSHLLPAESLPVGTGPFRLTQVDDGYEHEMFLVERNEYYFGERPELDAVRFDATVIRRLFDHPDGFYAGFVEMLREGLIDVGTLTVPAQYLPDGEAWPSTARGQSRPATILVVVNPSVPPLDSVDFRRALAASLDVAAFVENFGDGWAPTGITAPGLPGYSEESRLIPYDIDAARESFAQYVANGGYSPAEVFWAYGTSGAFESDREYLAEVWESALPVNFDLHFAHVEEYQDLRGDNLVAMRFHFLSPAYPHPNASFIDFRQLFGKGAESEELDRVAEMVEAARGHPDPIVQTARFSEVEQYLLDEALVFPLVTYPAHGFSIDVQPWVNGYTEPRYGGSRFKGVWFDETYPGGR